MGNKKNCRPSDVFFDTKITTKIENWVSLKKFSGAASKTNQYL